MRIEWIEHLWAKVFGYFWMPCPNCGRMYGGHEDGGGLYKSVWSDYAVPTCADPKCKEEVHEKNKRLFDEY